MLDSGNSKELNGRGILMLGRQAALGILIMLFALCTDGWAEIEPGGKADHPSQTIPLKQVWAWQMPGTQDVRKLEPKSQRLRHDSVVKQFRRILSRGLPKEELAGPGFVVVGDGEVALKNALGVMVSGKPLRETFSAGEELSVVFFTYSSGQYVHLKNVVRYDQRIELSYELVPHRTKELSEHFALVSLGKLSPGKYDVQVVRMPLAQEYAEAGFKPAPQEYVDRIVCQSFSFTVSN